MTTTETPTPVLEYEDARQAINPWRFVPTVYFLQGLPYFLVSELFAVVYKDLGLEVPKITL